MSIVYERDKLILSLQGDVPLSLFAKAVDEFNALVAALTAEVGEGRVEWEIDYLAAGSATVQVQAHSDDEYLIDQTVRAYEEVGQALATGQPVPYSQEVARHAYALTGLINGHIRAVQFGSSVTQFTVADKPKEQDAAPRKPLVSWGYVRGEARTLIAKPLGLNIYDSLFGVSVKCSLPDKLKNAAHAAWGKEVIVSGLVSRDENNGKPLSVRSVFRIDLVERPEGDYRQARGVIPYVSDSLSSETLIRQLRDGDN